MQEKSVIMGWFKNSFGIGAGVTLGDMAAQTGVTMVVDIIDGSTKKLLGRLSHRAF